MSQQINLFSPIFLRPRAYFSARAMIQALLMIAAGTVLLWLFLLSQIVVLESRVEEGDRMLRTERARLDEALARAAPPSRSELLRQEVARFEAELAERGAILEYLQGRAAAQNFSDYLAAFSRRMVHGVWLTAIEVGDGGTTLNLAGRALAREQIPAYIAQLSGEPLLRGRRFAAMRIDAPQPGTAGQETTPQPPLEFRLDATPVAEEPVSGAAR
jgi:Tfp pilus assembly protein PilN